MRAVSVILMLVLVSCAGGARLAPPPNIYAAQGQYPDAGLPANLKSSRASIFYVTDRVPIWKGAELRGYSVNRSDSMAFGRRVFSFGRNLSWKDLKSAERRGGARVPLLTLSTTEIMRFPATPLPFLASAGRVSTVPAVARRYAAAGRAMQKILSAELHKVHQDTVTVYVHGVRNTFDNATTTMANLWHFSGRSAVPVVYSWPTGRKGLLAYLTDRESSEFSVFHFKQFMHFLARTTSVRKINIVAHNQGSDLVTTALREMIIAERAAGRNPRLTLKIDALILAAPDLNFDVVRQRLIAERIGPAFGQIDAYMNPNDGALGLAQTVMKGVRFGRIRFQDLGPRERQIFSHIKNVNFINVEEARGRKGHAYFQNNPEVMSDISLTLRTGALPGTSVRPLEKIGLNFWTLQANYPFARKKPPELDQANLDRANGE